MKRFTNWKTLGFAVIFSLLVTWQPVITHACIASGGHGGC